MAHIEKSRKTLPDTNGLFQYRLLSTERTTLLNAKTLGLLLENLN